MLRSGRVDRKGYFTQGHIHSRACWTLDLKIISVEASQWTYASTILESLDYSTSLVNRSVKMRIETDRFGKHE